MRSLLEELGAEPVDAFEVVKRHQVERLGGWELKPFALMHSRFQEAILLDADNVPVREPSFLFQRPEFRETGALFWPDIVKLSSDNEIWPISGLRYRDIWSLESGQMVIDKSRCWRALSLTNWINQHSDAFYQYLHGDKDTFLIAWLMLEQPYHLIRHRPKLLESTLCQRDPDGEVLFQHRNSAKWIINGDNPRVDGFRLEDECRQLLLELARQWDGRVFDPPLRSNQARELEDELIRIGEFSFVRLASDEQRMKLLPNHRADCDARSLRYWYVADGPEGLELRFEGQGLQSCALKRSDDGIWRGQLLQKPYMPVELIPMRAGSGDHLYFDQKKESLVPLVERILEIVGLLPWDAEVARDSIGALRVLAAIDPAIVEWLRAEGKRSTPTSVRSRIVHSALDALHSDGTELAPGHGWLDSLFESIPRGYKRR